MIRRKVSERHSSPHHWSSPQGQHAWVSVLFPRLGEAKDRSQHRATSILHRAPGTKRSRYTSSSSAQRVPLEISIARSDTTGTSQESSPFEERRGSDNDLSSHSEGSHSDLGSMEDDPFSRQREPSSSSSFHLSTISFPDLPVTPAKSSSHEIDKGEPNSIPEEDPIDMCLFQQSLTTHDTVWDMTITTLEEEDSYDLNALPPLYTYHA